MKQKDIMLMLAIGVVSAVFAVVLSNFLISGSDKKQQKAEVVEAISDEFEVPTNKKYFSSNPVNPTQLIRLDGVVNNDPFKKPVEQQD